jgi:PAS domain S-box-containing protein
MLKLLLNNISHALLFESLQREIIFINQQFCDLFEIPVQAEMIVGADCSQAANQAAPLFKYPDEFVNRIIQVYENGLPVYNEEILFANGNVLYRDYKLINEDGISGHLWVYKNSNELKHILGKVQEQKDFYENILNKIPADIAIFNTKHQYIFLNRMAVLNDATREWLIGKDDYEYCRKKNLPNIQADRRRALFTKVLQTGEAAEFEEEYKTTNGSKIVHLRRFYPQKNNEGIIEYVIGYGMNITNIHEREEELLRRKQELHELVNTMNQQVVIIDENGKIISVNPSWVNMIGIGDEDCYGKEITTFIRANKLAFANNVQAFIKENKYKSQNRKVTIIDINKNLHTLTYYLYRFSNYSYEKRTVAIFFNDITLQLKAENDLKQIANQEKKLNDLKSNFMNMVSHELRTPLSVILSSTELIDFKTQMLTEGITSINNTSEYTSRILQQVDKMTQLMNDFLFVSKVESGKVPLKPVLFDINALIEKLNSELYSPWKDGRNLQYSVKGTPLNIIADESMIRLILINIINNAFKYSMGKSAPRLRLYFTQKKWKLLIIDFGIGIQTVDKKNLFQSFVRGRNVGDVEGTGLGLMVVKLFVKKNKGEIRIKSIEKKGTVVLIEFPY